MENQPAAGRQWFRLASQARMEPPQPATLPAPAEPPRRRGPPIRQASIALAMSNLALDTVTPAPEPPQTQSNTLLPPPLQVAAPPHPQEGAAPAPAPAPAPFSDVVPPKEPMPPASVQPTTMTPTRTITPPTTITLPRAITPPTETVPPKTQTPPPVIIPPRTITPPPTTMTLPRTITPPPTTMALPRTITPPTEPLPPKAQTPPPAITPPTTMTLPRTLTPPKEPVPPKTQTPPPVAEVIYKELTPAPATPLPTATILSPVQPPLARPPSIRNGNGSYSNLEKPSMPASDAMPVILSPIDTTKARTPPESPKVVKASSQTPPQSPRIKPATNLKPSSEPEPRALLSPQPKSTGLQDNPERNNGEQGELQKFIKHQAEARNSPPPSPKKEEKQAARPNGKALATRKDDTRIITIAGENYGAIMDLGSDNQLHGRKSQVHHLKVDEVQSGRDDGKSSNMANATSKTKPMIFLTNSNVQCVNNSIMFNASSVNRSPDVHINFTKRHQTNTTSSIPEGGHQPLH